MAEERWVTVHGRHVLISNGKPEWKGKQFTTKKNPPTDNDLLRACQNVNPDYNGKGLTSINCTKCVVAFEKNMRGEDVQARDWNDGTILNDKFDMYDWRKVFGLKSSDAWSYGSNLDRENVIKNIKMDMEDFGEGSRAIVKYNWNQVGASKYDNAKGGHVINVVQTKSGTKFIDSQSGGILKDNDILKYYKRGSLELYRVDDKEINEDIAKGAYKKRR